MNQQKGYDSKGRYFTDPNSDKYWDDYPLGCSPTPISGDFTYRLIECEWWKYEDEVLPYEASCHLPDGSYVTCDGIDLASAKRELRNKIEAFFSKNSEES